MAQVEPNLKGAINIGRRNVKELLNETIGFTPKDAVGWLYAARGFYKLRDYHSVIECIAPSLRNEKTKREAQHLLAFSFLHTGQLEASANAFFKSISAGNETDWQPLVEILIENPGLRLT